jgi:hypothetical protein
MVGSAPFGPSARPQATRPPSDQAGSRSEITCSAAVTEPCVKSKVEKRPQHVCACPTNAYNFWADALARIARAHVSGRSEAAIQPISVPWGEV